MNYPKCLNCDKPVYIDTAYAVAGFLNPWRHATSDSWACYPGDDLRDIGAGFVGDAGFIVTLTQVKVSA